MPSGRPPLDDPYGGDTVEEAADRLRQAVLAATRLRASLGRAGRAPPYLG
jgi:hypothetical protein